MVSQEETEIATLIHKGIDKMIQALSVVKPGLRSPQGARASAVALVLGARRICKASNIPFDEVLETARKGEEEFFK